MMRKALVILLLLAVALAAGCPARKPAPEEPAPQAQVVPETSKVGFSPVDLDKAPDVVKNVAGNIAKREAATWVQVNGTNYVLISTGEKAAADGKRIEVTDVTQRVPAQNFVWIDVKAKQVKPQENNNDKDGAVTVVTLNLANVTINGVGFEVNRTVEQAQTPSPAPAAQAPAQKAPTPAPTAPAPKPAPAPAPAAPAPKPAPAPRQAEPETPEKKDQSPTSGIGRELKP